MIRSLALLVIFLVAGLGSLAAAESVRVRAAAHEPPGKEAYGRIVFEWPKAVEYQAAIESGQLVVRFAEPFVGRLDVITRYLGNYVAGATVDGDGRTVSFPLKQPFRLKGYADGATIVLDLMGPATTASGKADAPQTTAKRAAAQSSGTFDAGVPLLPVRAGDHDGFGRLVFDWTRNVDYTVAHDGNRATVRFNQPAKLDLAALNERLPKTISAVESPAEGGGLTLTLTVADNARLRHFRSGTRVVFDVLKPAGAARADAVKPAPATRTSSAARKPPMAAVPQAGTVTAVAPPAKLLTRPSSKPVSSSSATEAAASRPGQSLDEVLAGIPGMAPSRAPASSAVSAQPASLVSGAAPSVPPQAAQQPVAAAPGRLMVHPLGTVNALTGLHLSWPQDVAGAVYERSGYVWFVFDRRAKVDFAGAWPRNAVKPQTVPTTLDNDLTLLRWPVPEGKHPGLRREGTDWFLDLHAMAQDPPADINLETHLARAAGSRLLLRGADFGAVRELRDPEVGDHLWVVPMAPAGQGVASERRFAELEMLATLQGVVVAPFTDEIVVHNVPEGVAITMPGGLHLSGNVTSAGSGGAGTGSPRDWANASASGSAGRTPIPALAVRSGRLFDFEGWGAGQLAFFDRKRELQRAVVDASTTSRNAARLNLAQFFFAHGHAADTLGILQVIEEDEVDAIKDPAFRALRGASRYLTGDYTAAGTDLFDGSLDVERETALWRGALLASQSDWIAASRYFAQADSVLRSYPSELRLRFGLLAAEAAFMIGDSGLAKFQLDALTRLKPSRVWMDQIGYLQGQILAKSNEMAAAAAVWERVMSGVHRPSKVKARFARAEMLLAAKRMTPAESITEIEKLRYAWRGDDLELAVLKRLGELYIQVGDYRNGLQTLREAVTYFPTSRDVAGIREKMQAAFATLYIGGEADKLPPLTALSLHDDFRDLVPAGEAGDMVASRLADRLVSVELLDRASEVLKNQIDKRLQGAALAEAVNRLALVHLLARQPEDALAVLNARIPPEAAPVVVAQRRQIKARALGELTRYKEALALLEGDNTQDADRLRAEIGWRTQNWPLAAYAFGRLVPAASQTLTDADRQTVLRLAIAQALNNNGAALTDLRKIYGAGMAQSAFKESFNLVTAPGEGPAVDLRAITRQVSEVDQFRTFLSSYRDKLLPRRDATVKPVSSVTPRVGTQTAAAN